MDNVHFRQLLGGRRSLYTPDLVKKIVNEVRLGASDMQTCITVGINPVSLWRWKARHPKFAEALRLARRQAGSRKRRKVRQVPNANGELVVSDGLNEIEQIRLRRAFERRQVLPGNEFFTYCPKPVGFQPGYKWKSKQLTPVPSQDEVLARLDKLREAYEAELKVITSDNETSIKSIVVVDQPLTQNEPS